MISEPGRNSPEPLQKSKEVPRNRHDARGLEILPRTDGAASQLATEESMFVNRSGEGTEITWPYGFQPDMSFDEVRDRKQRNGDVLILCSDSLMDMVSDERILEIVSTGGDLENTSAALVAEANAAGGRDSIRAIPVRYDGGRDDGADAP